MQVVELPRGKKIIKLGNNHHRTAKALMKYLRLNSIEYKLDLAKTQSYYFEFNIKNIYFEIRLSNHSKSFLYTNHHKKFETSIFKNEITVFIDSITFKEIKTIIDFTILNYKLILKLYNKIEKTYKHYLDLETVFNFSNLKNVKEKDIKLYEVFLSESFVKNTNKADYYHFLHKQEQLEREERIKNYFKEYKFKASNNITICTNNSIKEDEWSYDSDLIYRLLFEKGFTKANGYDKGQRREEYLKLKDQAFNELKIYIDSNPHLKTYK